MKSPAARKEIFMSKERLFIDNRINLQAAIDKNYTLEQCATLLHKSRSTIYREIVNNSYYKPCRHTCYHCINHCPTRPVFIHGECPKFNAYRCERWKHFPYTCNGCEDASICSHLKRYYDCIEADSLSKKKRKEPRVYKCIDPRDLMYIDEILIHGIRENGQSLHHLYESNQDLKDICSERTIRRYIYKGYTTVKAHELPRYVRYSHKYEYAKKKLVNVQRMLGRTYSDYLDYVNDRPYLNVWQYDSVEGKVDDKKAILTITYPETRFQFGYLISKQNSKSVFAKIRKLQKTLDRKYPLIFEVNLSDNGPEFSKFHELENDEYGLPMVKMFFTNPYRSTDKASCERNHEFIRYIIPKGRCLDFLTQEKVNLMFSHINSYVRLSNQNKTPYELTVEKFGKEFMQIVGIKKISRKDVCLKPILVRK